MVGVQCLAQGHFSGGNFNVTIRGFELATFRYQDRFPNRSATAAPNVTGSKVIKQTVIKTLMKLSINTRKGEKL